MNILRRILTRFRNPWRPTTEPPRVSGWYDVRTQHGHMMRLAYYERRWALWTSTRGTVEIVPGEGWEWRKP